MFGFHPKRFLLVTGGFVLAAFFSLYLFWHALLDRALESAIGVPVKFGGIHLRLSPIEVGLYHIEVKSLKKFQVPRMASIPEIFIRIQPGDLLKGKIHILEVRINIDEIIAERNKEGKVNLNELQKILAAKPQTPIDIKKFQIDKAVFTLTRVQYVDDNFIPPFTKVFFVNIYNSALEDVTNPRRATEQIIAIVLKKIGMHILNAQLNKMAGSFADQAKNALSGFLGAKIESSNTSTSKV